jgi:hypothetical protein
MTVLKSDFWIPEGGSCPRGIAWRARERKNPYLASLSRTADWPRTFLSRPGRREGRVVYSNTRDEDEATNNKDNNTTTTTTTIAPT